MSINLHLTATVTADLRLRGGSQPKEIVEEFDLYQTPTEVTEKALNSKSPLLVYLDWLKEICPNETDTYGIVKMSASSDFEDHYTKEEYEMNTEESSIPWDDLPKITVPSYRKEEEDRVLEWLKEHEGWTIEWYGV